MKKRIVSLVLAVVLSLAMVVPAMASENFVASVPAKDHPQVVFVVGPDGQYYIGTISEDGTVSDYVPEDCLVITSIAQADASTEIPEDAKSLLKEVYAKLMDGSMTLPYDQYGLTDTDTLVIRDLFDATWLCGEHPEMIEPEGIVLNLTFDLGLESGAPIYVFQYKNNEWNKIESAVNNGDGTVTCTFENLCPIAFVVDTSDYVPPIKTGDNVGNLGLWFGLLVASGVALVAIAFVSYTRKNRVH